MYPVYEYLGMEERCEKQPLAFPAQHQDRQPGLESLMNPRPISENPCYRGSGKLQGRVALVTGGDSGIGRAASVAFAKEGANLAVAYFDEHGDARETKSHIEQCGRRCLLIPGDLSEEEHAKQTVRQVIDTFGRLDVLVNNHAVQYIQDSILDITEEQLDKTFRTNIYSFFYLVKAALPYLKRGASIINTASITAYQGNPKLLDYSATKGAIVAFTRSLARNLMDQGIRVNGVAPGPIWTPLQPASYSAGEIPTFGTDSPMRRAGQPYETAACYVFLASDDSSYMSGQFLHPNGGYTGMS